MINSSRIISRVAVAKRFARYAPEEEQEVRKFDVKKENKSLEKLKDAWKKFKYVGFGRVPEYAKACKIIEKLAYSAKDVEKFSIALAEFQDEKVFGIKAGLFLSALINLCPETDFVIHTGHLTVKLNDLGFYNTKNVTIYGHVGFSLGARMFSGVIILNGNAGESVGREMCGGEIHINGDYEDIFVIFQRGRIYHNGKLIVEDGRKIDDASSG